MSTQSEILTSKLKELNVNLEFIKKTINRNECISKKRLILSQHIFIENDKPRLEKSMETVSLLTIEIANKFDHARFHDNEKLRVQKLKNDFDKKMKDYGIMLSGYRQKKSKELRELRQSLSARLTEPQNNRRDDDEEDSEAPQIELQEVNQQTLFYERMIQLKEKELLEIKDKMEEALKVQTEVAKLAKEQGKQLDIIEDNVDSARSNVNEAGELLKEGVEHHRSANRKKMCIFGIVFVILLVIIIPILVKVL